MKRLSLLVLVVLSAVFLALLSPYVLEPELYTKENGSYTPYHSDPTIMSAYSYERSTDIQAMMQELLDAPQPIVLNIQIRDFEEAEREFEEYKEQSEYFSNVVVNLDLSESALGDFRRENRKNMEALERMINESARFDEVNRLEIKYRDEENPALLYTIALEGEAIHNALNRTTTQFAEREPDILAVSTDLGLNTTKYQEAVALLEEIVEEDRKQQRKREEHPPVLPRASLSLSVSPVSGRYGDILRVAGTYAAGENVTLVLDSRDWQTLAPDEKGVFSTTLPIERIREGEHVLFATTGPLYSNLVTFSVVPTDTVLSFWIYLGSESWDEVVLDGELYAGELPVAGAPVRILVDDFEAVTIETDPEGYYYGSVNLTQGNHTLQAVFDDPGFPLKPSESEVKQVDLAPAVPLLVAVGVGGGALVLASLGVIWYIRRRNPPAEPVSSPVRSDRPVAESPEPAVQPPAAPSPVETMIRYQDLFAAGDWSGAALVLYRSVVDRFMPTDYDPYTLTPRELAARLAGTPAGGPFRSFVTRYEQVRYGGMPLQGQDLLLTHWNAVLAAVESWVGP